MVVRKLRGQSSGAVQQHRRSKGSCGPHRKDATVGWALSLDGSMHDTRSDPRFIQCRIARPLFRLCAELNYSRLSHRSVNPSCNQLCQRQGFDAAL